MLGKISPAIAEPRDAILRIVASWEGELGNGRWRAKTARSVPAQPCGGPTAKPAAAPENETLLHRENIYGSGPPIEEAGVQCFHPT